MRRSRFVVAALLAAGSVGCFDLTTNASEIVAIEFPDLPSPAVVAGDTLRDSTGKAVVLNARLFDAAGDEVTGQPVQFFTTDDGCINVCGVRDLNACGRSHQSIKVRRCQHENIRGCGLR